MILELKQSVERLTVSMDDLEDQIKEEGTKKDREIDSLARELEGAKIEKENLERSANFAKGEVEIERELRKALTASLEAERIRRIEYEE